MKSLTFFFISAVLISFSISSETILLKGNETIRGKIKNHSINSIKVEVKGEIIEISKDRILKIVYLDLTKSDEEKIRSEEEKAISNLPPTNSEDDKKNRDESNAILTEEMDSKKENSEPVEPPTPYQDPLANKSFPTQLAVTSRSALLPGWGQFTEKRIFSGIAFPSILIGLAALVSNENKKNHHAVNQYNSLANLILLGGLALNSSEVPPPPENTFLLYFSQLPNAKNSHLGSARNFSYAFIGVYILNILDAYLFYNENQFAKGFYFDYNRYTSYSHINISPSTSKVDQLYTVGYSIRF